MLEHGGNMKKGEKSDAVNGNGWPSGEKSGSEKASQTAQEVITAKMSMIDTESTRTGIENGNALGDRVIYDLIDVVEEGTSKAMTVAEFDVEIMKRVSEITEKIAREMIPDIAEKIIREEIEKLKSR